MRLIQTCGGGSVWGRTSVVVRVERALFKCCRRRSWQGEELKDPNLIAPKWIRTRWDLVLVTFNWNCYSPCGEAE
ncbi:unnamed protein product [Allacma fusca]|uniref:Uncharacterized protein n=1 Tax=Allacma fusca TaxID=39272 RepID=A0A8J2NRY9_9HEXA|nr:unnamed protein product [Allacma fusca]